MGRCFGAAYVEHLGSRAQGLRHRGRCFGAAYCGALGLEGTGAQAHGPLLRGSILWSTWALGHRGSGTWAAASGQHVVEHLGSGVLWLRQMNRCACCARVSYAVWCVCNATCCVLRCMCGAVCRCGRAGLIARCLAHAVPLLLAWAIATPRLSAFAQPVSRRLRGTYHRSRACGHRSSVPLGLEHNSLRWLRGG